MFRRLAAVILSALLLSPGWLSTTGLTLLVGFVPLLWVSASYDGSRRSWWRMFGWAALTFVLWNALTIWWIWYATPVGPPAATLASTTMNMIAFMLFHTVSKKAPKALAYTTLVTAWITTEYWYTVGDFSWPWLILGNGFSHEVWAVQWYEYTGVFGGTLWVLLANILIFEALRAADVEHQTDLIMTDLEKRTANVKENIAKNEADRAALSQAEADLLKTDHRIELAEGLSADCRQLLQNLADADKADEDAAARQAEYVAAQAALDSAEEEYSTMQRQLNANRAGLLAKDLQKGKPCPVCGSTKHPKIAALPKDHITEKQLEEREKELTAQRRTTAAASRTAGDAAAHAHELRAALQRDADGFFARRGDRYTGKPAAELTPDELKAALTAQQESLAEGLRGLQADHLKLKQKTDRAKSLAKQADILTRQLAELDKQQFAATRRAANAKAGHAAATARVQQMQETMPKRDNPDALERLQEALARLRSDRAAAMDARDAAVHRLHTNRAAIDALQKAMKQSAAAREKRAMWDNLSKTINGNLTGKIKLPFEQYVQAFYFDGVVEAANLRFTRMTDGQYRLLRRRSEAVSGKTALDLDVFDAYTGKTRPVGSLSGGESFMAALSLALGISDTIQQNAGGVVIETLFIDEGFGSLDADSLEKAIDTLAGLAGGDKLIGVISHVEALQDRLTRQIRVTKTRAGSKAEIEIS